MNLPCCLSKVVTSNAYRSGVIISFRSKSTKRRVKMITEIMPKRDSEVKASQLYDCFLVTDFEATCEASRAPLKYDQEIIEFPVYCVESKTFEIENVFHSFVRPTINPVISNFCSKLTGISQFDVANEPPLEEVLNSFHSWMMENILEQEKKFVFVTSGDWDLKKMLHEECMLKSIDMPSYFYPYVNVNKSFAFAMGKWPRVGKGRISAMLRLLNLDPIGNSHQGTSDCENIIKIMKALAERGYIFKATSSA